MRWRGDFEERGRIERGGVISIYGPLLPARRFSTLEGPRSGKIVTGSKQYGMTGRKFKNSSPSSRRKGQFL
jgi:hypothetical protein